METTELHYFQRLLNGLKFNELEEILMLKPFREMEDILYSLAYNPTTGDSNLLVYTFMQKLLITKETSAIHLSMCRLIGSILNHVDDNAELIGLYHGLRALELDPDNVDIMEYLLYFNHIPEKVLNDSLAMELAQKVVKKRPESDAAKITLAKRIFN